MVDETPTGPTDVIITEGTETPPLILGPQRLHYAFSVALPQAHLTFVSIVQGIAFGILLQDWPLPGNLPPDRLWRFLTDQYAYLPWVISVMLIILIWKQFVQASIFYIWPLTAGQIALMLLISLAEIVAFRTISDLGFWLGSIGVVGITGGMIRLNNLRLRFDFDYHDAKAKTNDDLMEWRSGFIYIPLGLLFIGAGGAFQYDQSLAMVLMADHALIHWAILGALFGVLVCVLVLDKYDMRQLVMDAAKGSDLRLNRAGGLRYVKPSIGHSPNAAAHVLGDPDRHVKDTEAHAG